jgi:tripartite-type tricarboxylate transporter receptor subunit TctC
MTGLQRRQFLGLAAGVAALPALARAARAETYPARPVHMLVGFAPGGGTDVMARAIQPGLSERLGQTIVIENRPGAGTNIATEAVIRATPDGYTLLAASLANAGNATLYPDLKFNFIRDTVPIAGIALDPFVLQVTPSLPVKTIPELIAYAKAHPGKVLFGSGGIGSGNQLTAEMFKMMAGIDIVHVPYRGSTGARTDILAGNVQMMFDSVPTMAPFIAANKVIALGTSGTKRSVALPDVPTLVEAGVPGYEATIWIGMMAPKGTPQPIVDRLNREIDKILNRPDIHDSWVKQDAYPDPMTPAQFGDHIQSEIAKWAKLIKANNIKAR